MHTIRSRRRQLVIPLVLTGALAAGVIAETSATAAGTFPMTVNNCGRKITIAKRPNRVVAIADDAVNNVAAAGGLNTIVGRAVASGVPVFRKATAARMGSVPILGERGKKLSTEVILGARPDLVIGEDDQGVSVSDMQSLGVPFLVTSGYCATRGGSDYVNVKNDIKLYGRLFGTAKVAAKSVQNITTGLAETQKAIAPAIHRRTAAALYLNPPTLAAYGYQSMSDTQFELLGLRNVFGNVKGRYITPNLEEIVKRNPDVIEVVTYPFPDKRTPNLDDLVSFPGMDTVTAVKNGDVVFLPYAYSSQGPFAVDGLKILARKFGLLK